MGRNFNIRVVYSTYNLYTNHISEVYPTYIHHPRLKELTYDQHTDRMSNIHTVCCSRVSKLIVIYKYKNFRDFKSYFVLANILRRKIS